MLYGFSDCLLDPDSRVLRRGGEPVHVEPQVFDLIVCLVRAQGRLVTYDDLIEEVWRGRIVSDAAVASRVSAARAALGDDGRRQAIIRTVSRHGVQLVPAVQQEHQVKGAVASFGGNQHRQVIRYATSQDGTGIAWAETGDGPPLLRGGHWLGHLEHDWLSPVWRPLLDRLSNGRRLIRYDPRGSGLSDPHMNGATVEELADDMEAVADAAGLERFPIYAVSQSVPVALTLAARRPDRVSRLVLLNGLVRGSTARGEHETTETIIGMIRTGWGVPGSAFMRAIATVFIPRSTPEEVDSLVEMQALSATPEMAANLRRTIAEIDVSGYLGRVNCPALVMHSSGDQVQSPDQSRRIASALSDAEFQLFDSPNHVLVPSDPVWGPCLEEIDRFLSEDLSEAEEVSAS